MDQSETGLGRTLGLSLIFGAAMALSACGGSSSRTVNNNPPAATPAPTPQPTAAPTPAPTPAPSGGEKVTGPMDPVQDGVVTGVIVDQVGSQLPSPLDGTVACAAAALNYLVDAPDSVLASSAGLADGADPYDAFNAGQANMQASLERFAAMLQSTLVQMSDRGTCDPAVAGSTGTTNPLSGTPLAAIGQAVLDLSTALGETDGDPNLTSVTATLAPALTALSAAMGTAPAELQNAPVIGATLASIADAVTDVAAIMPHVGNYDGANTAATTGTMIDNLLNNVLLGVVPVADVDAATGQTFSADIAAGIAQLSATLGSGVGQVVTPLFNQGLNGALSPLQNPSTGALGLILNPSALNATTGLWEVTDGSTVDPLQGVLAGAVGDGNLTGSPVDALLALVIGAQGGLSLDEIIAGFALTNGTQLANVSALVSDANAAQVDGVLNSIQGFTGGIYNFSLVDALNEVTGDLVSDFLGGLL